MIAGTLELQMLANLAQLRQDMNEAKNVVGGAMSSMNSAIGNLKTGMQALVGYFSIHYIEGFLERIFEGITKMHEFGKEAGVSAEALSRFEAPARMAGSSVELVAASMFRMNKALTEAKNPSSNAAQALTAIGLSIKDLQGLTPDQQFEKIARAMDKFAEGTDRNAIAMTLFSRGGKEVNKLIEEIGKTTQLTSTITDEQAEAAKKLEDEFVKLKMASEAMWRHTISDFIPGLTKVVEKIGEAARETGLWKTELIGLAGIFGIDLTDALGKASSKTKQLYDDIFNLQKRIDAAPSTFGANAPAMIKRYEEQIAKLRAQLASNKVSSDAQLLYDLEAPGNFKPAPKFDPTRKGLENASDSLIATLQKELQKTTDLYVADEKYKETLIEIAKLKKEGKIVDENKIINLAKEIDLKKILIQHEKFLNEEHDKELAFAKQSGDAVEALANNWADATEQLEMEASLLGKSNLDRQIAVLLEKKRLDIIAAGGNAAAIRDINAEYEKQVGLLKKISDSQAAIQIWDKIGDAAGNFFSDLVMNGHKAFDNFRTMLKQLAADLLAFFAKKYFLQMIAGVAGAGSATANAASAAENMMGSSLMGMAVSGMGGMMSAGAGSLVGTLGTGLSANIATLGIAMDAGAAAVGGFAEVALAAIPVIGWIVAIGAILYTIFGRKGGAPKSGGSFLGSFGANGQLIDDLTPSLDRHQHLQDETNMDSTARKVVSSMGVTFAQMVARYGGSPTAMQFGLGFNSDKGGSAPSMVSSLVRDATGRTLFEQSNRNVGRSDQELSDEIQLQMSRMILAGLQNSDLPSSISHILNTLDAATATQDAINNIYAIADAFKQLSDLTTAMDLDAMLKEMAKGPMEQFHDMGTSLLALGRNTQMTAASLQNMGQATLQYRQQVVQLIQSFEDAKNSIHSMYEDTSRSIRMAGMSPQQQYDFFQNEAAGLLGQIQTSNSAQEISSLSQRINQDIMSAFNLLTPEQQQSMQQDFLTRITSTDQTTHARLEAVQKAAVDEANRVLGEIKGIMDEAAAKMGKAGDDISTAAATQHVDVDIHVQDDRLQTVVNESGG